MSGSSKKLELGPSELPERHFTRLLKSVVVPRPIAWVSTTSESGVDNLAPHSFFTVASQVPPIVQFTSIGRNDSFHNATRTGEFVINLADLANANAVNASGTPYPADEDEFVALGIRKEASVEVAAPRVADSPVAIECRTEEIAEFENSVVIFGRVVHLAIDEAVMVDGHPEITKLQPMARLGKDEWSEIGRIHRKTRIPLEEAPRQSPEG